jgi:hypothetical protein
MALAPAQLPSPGTVDPVSVASPASAGGELPPPVPICAAHGMVGVAVHPPVSGGCGVLLDEQAGATRSSGIAAAAAARAIRIKTWVVVSNPRSSPFLGPSLQYLSRGGSGCGSPADPSHFASRP